MTTRIFVYGTLKKNFVNEPLLADQQYLGKVVLAEAHFLLYEVDGRYTFPALVRSNTGGGYRVYGELYEVNDACLKTLDVLEGVSIGLYERRKVKVLHPDGRLEDGVTAYCFCRDSRGLRPVGPVWPSQEINRYRFVGHTLREEEKELEFDGFALYNTHQGRWVTSAFESESELRSYCKGKSGRFGAPAGSSEPWASKWFEVRPRKGTRVQKALWIVTVPGEESPVFPSRDELAEWAATNLRFFGGEAGTIKEWRELLAEVSPKIDED